MFEALSHDTLSELVKVGDRALFKNTTSLDELLACLEQAVKECRQPATPLPCAPADLMLVAGGLQAAQKMLAAWWHASAEADKKF